MNKKKILLTILLMTVMFFSTSVKAKTMAITCEYNNFMYMSSGGSADQNVVAKLKVVVNDDDSIELYDNARNVLLENASIIAVYQKDKLFYQESSFPMISITKGEKESFLEAYKKSKTCPTITSQPNMNTFFVKFIGQKYEYNEELFYYPTEADKTTYGSEENKPTESEIVKVNNQCIYSIPAKTISNIPGFDIIVRMYSDGVKEMCVRARTGFTENCKNVQFNGDENDATFVTASFTGGTYYMAMMGKDIKTIFSQPSFSMIEHNKFNCVDSSSLYFTTYDVSLNKYYITTDKQYITDNSIFDPVTVDGGTLTENGDDDGTNNTYDPNVTSELDTSATGCGIISEDLKVWLVGLLNLVRIGALVLTLIFGMLDFTKATLSSDKDALKKARESFFKRLMAVVLLFIIPAVISFILGISGIPIFTDDPFCGLK